MSESSRLIRNLVLASWCVCTAALAQLTPVQPSDRPIYMQAEQAAKIEAAIAPYVAEARNSYPAAKLRFLNGLPPGQIFFVTVQLKDTKGHCERIFIRVRHIRGTILSGSIASDIVLLDGFKAGQGYSVDESEILDWLIAKPDGSEEGNVVGNFLDSYMP